MLLLCEPSSFFAYLTGDCLTGDADFLGDSIFLGAIFALVGFDLSIFFLMALVTFFLKALVFLTASTRVM